MGWIPSYTEGSSIILLMLMLWFLGCPVQGEGLDFSDPFAFLPQDILWFNEPMISPSVFGVGQGPILLVSLMPGGEGLLPAHISRWWRGFKSSGRFAGYEGLWVTLEVRNPPRAHLHSPASPVQQPKAAPLPPTPPCLTLLPRVLPQTTLSCTPPPDLSFHHLLIKPDSFWGHRKADSPGGMWLAAQSTGFLLCKCEMFLQ